MDCRILECRMRGEARPAVFLRVIALQQNGLVAFQAWEIDQLWLGL